MTTPRIVLCPNRLAGKRANKVRVKAIRRLIGAKKGNSINWSCLLQRKNHLAVPPNNLVVFFRFGKKENENGTIT
jgi:hypothetical protein